MLAEIIVSLLVFAAVMAFVGVVLHASRRRVAPEDRETLRAIKDWTNHGAE